MRAAYAGWARNWRDDGPVRAFAARDPDTCDLVGGCELRIQPDGSGEAAYWVHVGQRGRRHARNVLELLAGYAASIGVTRLEAHAASDNHASRRVAESAGFTYAGTFTDDDGTEMTRPPHPRSPAAVNLFSRTAAYYRQYRPGIPAVLDAAAAADIRTPVLPGPPRPRTGTRKNGGA